MIERYVEVGPSKILANMAAKQIGREKHSESHLVNRQFLASSDNAKDIFYQYDDNEPESADNEPAPASSPAPEGAPATTAAAPAPPPAAPVASAPATAAAAVDDTPLTATDAVIAITAQKLRKGFDEVPSTKTIQELSGGTLECANYHYLVC
jgi:fatty acid synthase subunit alpha, fungi type